MFASGAKWLPRVITTVRGSQSYDITLVDGQITIWTYGFGVISALYLSCIVFFGFKDSLGLSCIVFFGFKDSLGLRIKLFSVQCEFNVSPS